MILVYTNSAGLGSIKDLMESEFTALMKVALLNMVLIYKCAFTLNPTSGINNAAECALSSVCMGF